MGDRARLETLRKRKRLKMLRLRKAEQSNPNDPSGAFGSAIVGIGQGLTFDKLDEMVAGAHTLFDSEEAYQKELERVRTNYKKLKKENPDVFQLSKSAGELALPVGVMAKFSIIGKLLKSAPTLAKGAMNLIKNPKTKEMITKGVDLARKAKEKGK